MIQEFPLNESQRGVYFECIERPESVMYNIPIEVSLPKDTDEGKFAEAVRKVAEAHPALFVTIGTNADGEPVMRTGGKSATRTVGESGTRTEGEPVMRTGGKSATRTEGESGTRTEGEPVMRNGGEAAKAHIAFSSAKSREEARNNFKVKAFDLEKGPLYRFEIATTPEGPEFFFDIHHLVFDGTSLKLFCDQISAAYEGRDPEPEEKSLFEQALQSQKVKETEAYARAKEFFKEKFDGLDLDIQLLPDVNHIPDDQGKTPKPTDKSNGAIYYQSAPNTLSLETVKQFAAKSGVTNNAFFMAAFSYALSVFSGTNESFFTIASAGRKKTPEYYNTVGMMVKPVPLYYKYTPEEKTEDFVKEVYGTMRASVDNDIISFGDLVRDYGINNDISFVYQSNMYGGIKIGETQIPLMEIFQEDIQCNIVFMLLKAPEGFKIQLHYNRCLYTEKLMASLADTFFTVAEEMLVKETLRDIDITSLKTIGDYAELNRPHDVSFARNETCVTLLDNAFRQGYDKIAIEYRNRRISYMELKLESGKVASKVLEAGIKPNEFVAILVPRNEYMVIASWGVIRAGAAFQPIDPTYPEDRIQYMIEDSKARLVIADRALRPLLGNYPGAVLYTDEISALPEAENLPQPQPSDAITIIYTSGTTGKPKGCVLEHRNLVAFFHNHASVAQIGDDSRIASYASFGFDAGVMDIMTSVMAHATICIIPDEIRLDLPALEKFFVDNHITNGFMTTQLGRMFVQQTECQTLKCFHMGGEKLVPFVPRPTIEAINGYGPCESMAYICYHIVTDNGNIQPIGKPCPDVRLYVLDKLGRRVPAGAVGELAIAGPQVGRGYLGLPEKTKEVFVPNPFDQNEEDFNRMYLTGDVVRLLPEGELDFVGRRDGQVKVRGFRIELTEIEEVIRRFDGIKDATVAAFDDPAGGKYLAAYVVAAAPLDPEDLKAFILSEKPSYMVPAAIMQLEAIPYNQNHKVNRRALPEPSRAQIAGEIVKPETDIQQQIWDTAAEILGHKEFGITTDLFAVGMTSIGLLKFNAQLAKAFSKPLKISELKELKTIKLIEKYLNEEESSQTSYEIRDKYPLMENQMGVFLECEKDEDTLEYNIPFIMKVDPELDLNRLKKAYEAAIDAHPYMKVTLATNGEGVFAERHDAAAPLVALKIVNNKPSNEELVKPFKLIGEPLYRAAIYNTSEGNFLFLDVHHIIADGTSIAILLGDIDKAYRGEQLTKETYTAFEASLEETDKRASEAYYKKLLGGANTECSPAKSPEPSDRLTGKAAISIDAGEIKAFAKRNNLGLNAYFNAVFSYVLSEFIHSDEVTYVTIYNGRNDSRLAGDFAMLVKTIPVTTSIDYDKKPCEFVEKIQNQLIDTMANDAMSFADISNTYGVKPDIFFNYQGDNFVFDTMGGKPAETTTIDLDVAKAPLSFEVFLDKDGFRVEATWRTDTYCKEFGESILASIEAAAKGFTETDKLGEVSIMNWKEWEHFREMNAHEMNFEPVRAVDIFRKYAEQTPDKPAVKTREAELTFKELDEMSSRLANALIAKGAKDGDVVAMVLNRTVYAPVAQIGIMKAGCAFLPMLPTYPEDRIEYCKKDAKVGFTITDENIKQLIAEGGQKAPESLGYDPERLVYMIYTSGSTGTPKGVMLEEHNLTNFIQTGGLNRTFGIGETLLCMASFSFDMSITETFCSLAHGNTIYIAAEEEIHNLDLLHEAFVRNGIDHMMMTPSFAWSLLSIKDFEDALAKMKAVVLGAEAFQPTLFARLKALNPDMLIQNGYGPTEATQVCSCKEITDGSKITIGQPFANTKFYIMDERGHFLPRYAVGELIIAGEGICRGYVGLPEKNKQAFFSIDGVKAYHSGDLVRINRDNEAEFGGRKDNQVKLRGFRIELDEVETVMEEFPEVTRAKVVVRNNGSEDFLAGFFTADKPVNIDELTCYMKSKLTYYMVPGAMMQLEAMPMTQGGKLDKKALPEITLKPKERGPRKAPKKSLEEKILDEFKAVIGTDDIYVDDNFFEAGGTSLSASKAVMKIKSQGFKIEYQDIFDHQTAEELAEYLEGLAPKAQPEAPGSAATPDKTDTTLAEVLKYNTLDHSAELERKPLGDVLLTGATGFLGCHILRELLRSEEGTVHCLMRRGHYDDIKERLKVILFYYFEETFDDAFESGRIDIIEGDITSDNLADLLAGVRFDTLINCAACVKHFASDNSIEFVNVHGVENLISVVKAHDARMIQISTTSIPGSHTEESYARRATMHENELFVIDDMNNQYIQSKYKAEVLVLNAVAAGMKGKIIRVGNLMGRYEDGEFQINMRTNAFLNALRGFVAIGKCPISHGTDPMGFSPIDCTARAVVLLSGTNDCFTAFNADSRWIIDEMNVIDAVNAAGIKITPVPDKEYYDDFYRMMADPAMNEKVSALLTNDRPDIHVVETDNRFTANILYRLGFSWPLIDQPYLIKIVHALDTLGFFS